MEYCTSRRAQQAAGVGGSAAVPTRRPTQLPFCNTHISTRFCCCCCCCLVRLPVSREQSLARVGLPAVLGSHVVKMPSSRSDEPRIASRYCRLAGHVWSQYCCCRCCCGSCGYIKRRVVSCLCAVRRVDATLRHTVTAAVNTPTTSCRPRRVHARRSVSRRGVIGDDIVQHAYSQLAERGGRWLWVTGRAASHQTDVLHAALPPPAWQRRSSCLPQVTARSLPLPSPQPSLSCCTAPSTPRPGQSLRLDLLPPLSTCTVRRSSIWHAEWLTVSTARPRPSRRRHWSSGRRRNKS